MSPGFDSQPGGPVGQPYLTYRHARLHTQKELIPWNRFLGSLNVPIRALSRVKEGKSIPGTELEPSKESITNIYPRLYCTVNLAMPLPSKNSDINDILEDTAGVLLAP